MVFLGTLCSLSFAGRQGPPFFPPPAPTSYNSATDSWLLALFTLQVIAGANSVERLVALLVWAAPSPALDCDSTETEAHGAPPQFPTLAAPWCSFRLRKRAPADQEGHNRVCVCRVGGPGRGGAAERRRCSMERTAASLLLFSRATRTTDLGPIHAPQTWVGHIPTSEAWVPFLS